MKWRLSQTTNELGNSVTDLRVELAQEISDHGPVIEQYLAQGAYSGERPAIRHKPGFWCSESCLLAEFSEQMESSMNDMSWYLAPVHVFNIR